MHIIWQMPDFSSPEIFPLFVILIGFLCCLFFDTNIILKSQQQQNKKIIIIRGRILGNVWFFVSCLFIFFYECSLLISYYFVCRFCLSITSFLNHFLLLFPIFCCIILCWVVCWLTGRLGCWIASLCRLGLKLFCFM